MQTVPLTLPTTACAWLERLSGERIERIDIATTPFLIGRSETCHLPVASTRVSREHATIVLSGAHYVVRDPGSTNGTFVNGQRVQESRLTDGDLLKFADLEVVFRCSSGLSAPLATQVLAGQPAAAEGDEPVDEVRIITRQHRARQEAVLHRAARVRYHAIFDLATGTPHGYTYSVAPTASVSQHSWTDAVRDCRLAERWHEVQRNWAVERSHQLAAHAELFVRLEMAEVGADDIPRTIAHLQGLAGASRRLVAVIPDASAADIPYFRNFLDVLRGFGVGIAYEGFSGSATQLKARQGWSGNYLQLLPAMTRGIDRSTERLKQLSELTREAAALGTRVIVSDLHSEAETDACRRAGCELGTGELFGAALTLDASMDG